MTPEIQERGASLSGIFNFALSATVALPILGTLGALYAAWTMSGSHPLGSITTPPTLFAFMTLSGAIVLAIILGILWSQVRATLRRQVAIIQQFSRSVIESPSHARLATTPDDEFSQVAAAINAILDTRSEAGHTDVTTIQQQIEKLLGEINPVAAGDLTVQANVTPDNLGVLADFFNYIVEELGGIVRRVQNTTQQVLMTTRTIREQSNGLARSSNVQSEQIIQVSEQVADLAAFILQTSRDAILSMNAAMEAQTNARTGKEAVERTIEVMRQIRTNVQETSKMIKRLGERSQEINDIVRIIQNLSEETNLLALNATIQSQVSGDGSRGFGVVADEIRLLAERSTDAARRVVDIVSGIQEETKGAVIAMEDSTTQVVAGTKAADAAGQALDDILMAVDLQVRTVEEIARAADQRTQTSTMVTMAMGRIASIIQQTNATVADTTRGISYLADQADQLRASVATFRLPPVTTGQAIPGMLPPPIPYSQGAFAPQPQGTFASQAAIPSLPPAFPRPAQTGAFDQSAYPPPRPPTGAFPPSPYSTGQMGSMPAGMPPQVTNRPMNPAGPPAGNPPSQPVPPSFDPWEDQTSYDIDMTGNDRQMPRYPDQP